MEDTSGFYKFDGQLLYAPNFVLNKDFELRKTTKHEHTYPTDGWHWFDSEDEARTFLKVPKETTGFNPDLTPSSFSNMIGKPFSSFIPTPLNVIHQIFKEVKINSHDKVYDLGCGKGDVIVYTSSMFGSTGVGIDIDEVNIFAAKKSAELAEVSDKTTFIQKNFYFTNFNDATVVYLYLTQESLSVIEDRIFDLSQGTRIISLLNGFVKHQSIKEIQTNIGTCYLYEIGK